MVGGTFLIHNCILFIGCNILISNAQLSKCDLLPPGKTVVYYIAFVFICYSNNILIVPDGAGTFHFFYNPGLVFIIFEGINNPLL